VKHAVMLIWVPIGVYVGTAESEACSGIDMVPIDVDFGTAESEACSGVDMGTNWCLRRDS